MSHKLLHLEENYTKRKIKESLEIIKNPNNFNRDVVIILMNYGNYLLIVYLKSNSLSSPFQTRAKIIKKYFLILIF